MAGGESMWKLMGGLLALPVLLVLSVLMIFWGSGDYVRTVQLNWELELPASEGCLYETDSGASFSGDGERYHVLAYADDSGLEETLTEEATPGQVRRSASDRNPGSAGRSGGPAGPIFRTAAASRRRTQRMNATGCTCW